MLIFFRSFILSLSLSHMYACSYAFESIYWCVVSFALPFYFFIPTPTSFSFPRLYLSHFNSLSFSLSPSFIFISLFVSYSNPTPCLLYHPSQSRSLSLIQSKYNCSCSMRCTIIALQYSEGPTSGNLVMYTQWKPRLANSRRKNKRLILL